MGFYAAPGAIVDGNKINEMGFQGDNLSRNKKRGVVRILTLGGSVIFNNHFTDVLKEKLGAAFPENEFEILGAALPGQTTRASVLKYQALREYDFDYVIIYHAINDLGMNHVPSILFKKDYSHYGPWNKSNFMLRNSFIARTLYNVFSGSAEYNFLETPPGWFNASKFATVATFKANMEQLLADIESDGAIPIIMTFAWALPSDYDSAAVLAHLNGYNTSDDKSWRHYGHVDTWGPYDFVKEGLTRHNSVIRGIASSRKIPLIDQEKIMGGDLNLFVDVCHFSSPGRDMFIDNILIHLGDKGYFRFAGSSKKKIEDEIVRIRAESKGKELSDSEKAVMISYSHAYKAFCGQEWSECNRNIRVCILAYESADDKKRFVPVGVAHIYWMAGLSAANIGNIEMAYECCRKAQSYAKTAETSSLEAYIMLLDGRKEESRNYISRLLSQYPDNESVFLLHNMAMKSTSP